MELEFGRARPICSNGDRESARRGVPRKSGRRSGPRRRIRSAAAVCGGTPPSAGGRGGKDASCAWKPFVGGGHHRCNGLPDAVRIPTGATDALFAAVAETQGDPRGDLGGVGGSFASELNADGTPRDLEAALSSAVKGNLKGHGSDPNSPTSGAGAFRPWRDSRACSAARPGSGAPSIRVLTRRTSSSCMASGSSAVIQWYDSPPSRTGLRCTSGWC